MTTLLLSSRLSDDNQALWRAAVRAGWDVERVHGLRVPEGLEPSEVVLYVEALYAPIIAESLGITLVEPDDDWLVKLPYRYRCRNIQLISLAEARRLTGPTFVKPPNDKSFEAKVYRCGDELPAEFDEGMVVLACEPVEFEVEYRCFVLNRTVRTLSPYVRHGRLSQLEQYAALEDEIEAARRFAAAVLADTAVHVPRAVVLDVGRIRERGWAIVEVNAAWGAGIYGCNPASVLEVLRYAVHAGEQSP